MSLRNRHAAAGEGQVHLRPSPRRAGERCSRPADLVFDPTLACGGFAVARASEAPTRTFSRASVEGPGQGLLLNRSMLGDQGSPYVGRFARGWHRLPGVDPRATTDPDGSTLEYRRGLRDGASREIPEAGP